MSDKGLMNFNQYCRDRGTWIIKYSSLKYTILVYLIWYNDAENHHRPTLLTYRDGKIFHTLELQSIKNIHEESKLIFSDQLKLFIYGLDQFQSITCTYFDMIDISQRLNLQGINLQNLSWIYDFIQLVNDYRTSWPSIKELNNILSNPLIEKMEQYYNDSILIPQFQGHSIEQSTIEDLPIQRNDLMQILVITINAFEECFS